MLINKINEIITEEIKKYRINEDPDTAVGGISCSNDDAVAFGYANEGADITIGRWHSGLIDGYDREDLVYPGRIWTKSKIISFWRFPETFDVFKKIVNDLEGKLGITIFNNNFRVEIPKNNKNVSVYDDWYGELINVEDYLGGHGDMMRNKEHEISPLLKKGKKGPPPYDKYAEIGLKNTPPAKYRAIKYKYVDENNKQ
jgi:hypothetical protein